MKVYIYWTKLPLEENAKEVMDEDYREYVKDNGYHFTNSLSEYASKMLTNADGSSHHWSVEQVRASFESMNLKKSERDTWGDIAYIANMAYSDFCPSLITPEGCLRYASMQSNDKDGYDGMAFMRFTSDLIGRGLVIDFDAFT